MPLGTTPKGLPLQMADDEDAEDIPLIRDAVEERLKLRLPALQAAFEAKTGEQISISDLQEVLTPEMLDVAEQVTQVTISHNRMHSGPLPSPQTMREYAEIYPDAAKQFFGQLKREQDHRHEWELTHLNGALSDRRRKDLAMLAVAAGGLAICAILAFMGAPEAAAVSATIMVLGGGALALGRRFLATHSKDGLQVQLGEADEKGAD